MLPGPWAKSEENWPKKGLRKRSVKKKIRGSEGKLKALCTPEVSPIFMFKDTSPVFKPGC
jgi:hypothetical protein